MHEDSTIKPPLYRDLWVRIFVSVLAAHLVLALNEPENFIELVQLQGYLPLLLQNWLLVFLIFNCVRSITIVLDKDFPWAGKFTTRIFFQVFFGMGVPIFLCLMFASLYFSHHDMNMADTGYLKLELWFSILFITILNFYYSVYYFAYVNFGTIPTSRKNYPTWTLTRRDEIKNVNESDVAVFYIENGVCFACLMDGEKYKIDRSLGVLMGELSADEFFRIHRSAIVSRQAIAGLKVESSNRLSVCLKIDVEGDFCVSQRNVKDFKKWFR